MNNQMTDILGSMNMDEFMQNLPQADNPQSPVEGKKVKSMGIPCGLLIMLFQSLGHLREGKENHSQKQTRNAEPRYGQIF